MRRVQPGSTAHADEASHWNALHARFEARRINHTVAFSDVGGRPPLGRGLRGGSRGSISAYSASVTRGPTMTSQSAPMPVVPRFVGRSWAVDQALEGVAARVGAPIDECARALPAWLRDGRRDPTPTQALAGMTFTVAAICHRPTRPLAWSTRAGAMDPNGVEQGRQGLVVGSFAAGQVEGERADHGHCSAGGPLCQRFHASGRAPDFAALFSCRQGTDVRGSPRCPPFGRWPNPTK